MRRKIRNLVRMATMIGLSVCLVVLTGDAWAQRRGGGMHARPNVSRQGPARSGSFNSNRNKSETSRIERSAADRRAREERMARRDPGPDRMDARRMDEAERGRGRDRDDRRYDDRRDDRYEDRPVAPERVEARRENRRDYYDDRRDDRRQFARGARYSAVWWSSNSCRQTVVVVQDGYSYYQCNGEWFGRSYYGGEVTYTVIDPPQGY